MGHTQLAFDKESFRQVTRNAMVLLAHPCLFTCTVEVKKTFPKTFTIQPLNVVPTAKRNSGNGKRRLTVRPLTVPFSARVCHAHFSLATRVRYPQVVKLVSTLHEPWQRPTAPKALKNPVDFDAIVRSWWGSYAPIASCGP